MEAGEVRPFEEEGIQLEQEPEAVFEEWAAGSSVGDRQLEEDEEDEEDEEFIDKAPELHFRRKKGNNRSTTVLTCDVCGTLLKHPSRIKEHMRTHTGEKPFACDICGLRFSQKTPMINHFRVQHMGDLPFVCNYGCGKRFVNNSRKNAHELRHIGLTRNGPPRPHLKPEKKLVAVLSDDLPLSNNLSNSAVANFNAPTLTDDVLPSTRHSQRQSLRKSKTPSMDALKGPLFPDESCSKTVKSKADDSAQRIDDVITAVLARVLAPPLEEEEAIVEKQEPSKKRTYTSNRALTVAQCTICGLMLKHPSKIAEHIRTHTGEKPFECGECGMCLSKATSLKVHIRRMHTSERPFPCEWNCGMWFVTESVKREHEMAIHAGVKRYTCGVKGCNAVFARRGYLMRHRKNAHAEVFDAIFHSDQVENQEGDPGIETDNNKQVYITTEEQVLLFGEDVKMGHPMDEPYDEEEFVEQQMSGNVPSDLVKC